MASSNGSNQAEAVNPDNGSDGEGDVDKLVMNTFFPEQPDGVLVEVGAASPDYLSIGKSFRALGWRVISIEPNPVFAARHRILGHDVQEYACGEEDCDDIPFFIVEAKNLDSKYRGGNISYESFSSLGIRGDFKALYDRMADRFTVRQIMVGQRRLDTILDSIRGLEKVDILSIDIEGWELECLRAFSFNRFNPKVLIIEDYFGKTEID